MNFRLSKLKSAINKQGLDAVLVSSVPNITYLTSFSGFSGEEREAFIFITTDKQYILTDKRYRDEIKDILYSSSEQSESRSNEHSSRPASQQGGQARAINIFQLEEVSSSIPFRLALEKLAKKHKIKKLGIEENNLTVSEYKSLKRCFNDLNHFSINDLRAIKDKEEISIIQKACELTDKTFDYILTKIKPGVTEKELAFQIEFFIKNHGGDLAFPSIVAFGKNSAAPHHKTSNTKITHPVIPVKTGIQKTWIPNQVGNDKNENIILLDFGAKVNNYCSDMTRVVFLGKATDEQKRVYETVLKAQQKAIDFLKNVILSRAKDLNAPRDSSASPQHDIMASEVDKVAHDYIRSKGYGENIFHSLGHGVGLEIHEAPRLSPKSKETLKPGMVFTIEPGIYLPEKFGVRIEDTVVLEKNGLRLLTCSPKTLIEL